MPSTLIHHRRLNAKRIRLLDIISCVGSGPIDGEEDIRVYLRPGTDVSQVQAHDTLTRVDCSAYNNAPVLLFRGKYRETYEFMLNDRVVSLTPDRPETTLFQGKKVVVAIRNGQNFEQLKDWISYNCDCADIDSIVIFDRGRPNDQEFQTGLIAAFDGQDLPCDIVQITCDLPLGKAQDVDESHPFHCPFAATKERMENLPDADPWTAPLDIGSLYEILRYRFLSTARAVVNIDVSDLLRKTPNGDVFDTVLSSRAGYISVMLRYCFPWKVKPGRVANFADHTCIQFDNTDAARKWCIAPERIPYGAVWRLNRVTRVAEDTDKTIVAFRYAGVKHHAIPDAKLAPKASLIAYDPLVKDSKKRWKQKIFLPPSKGPEVQKTQTDRRAIITTMKNEGPFLLEWLAYHRVVGFDDFLIYTNDCTDGTDEFFDLLQRKGYVQHRDNPFRETGLKPQHAALHAAQKENIIKNAKWVTCIDVDEFVNIKVGAGTLDDLFAAVPDANFISMTWRLFGNGFKHDFQDAFTIGQFDRCAPENCARPHQAWGFKTLFQNNGIFRKFGVHRPKGLNAGLWDAINWVNGSGKPMPSDMYRSAWRSTKNTYGYDLVSLNHYAVRNCESFLVKRDRGRVNHVDRDQGLAYWFRMNNNADKDVSIMRMIPALQKEFDKLMQDPEIAQMQKKCTQAHVRRIAELKESENYLKFFKELKGERLEKLSRMHRHFGKNVFLAGPQVIPDELITGNTAEDMFFTVEDVDEAQH